MFSSLYRVLRNCCNLQDIQYIEYLNFMFSRRSNPLDFKDSSSIMIPFSFILKSSMSQSLWIKLTRYKPTPLMIIFLRSIIFVMLKILSVTFSPLQSSSPPLALPSFPYFVFLTTLLKILFSEWDTYIKKSISYWT